MSNQNFGLTNSTTYSPKQIEDFYAAVLLTGETKSLVRQFVNVKNSFKVPNLDWGNLLQEEGCEFESSGTATLSSKTLSVCAIKINAEICQSDLENSMLADSLRPGSNHGELPTKFEDYLIERAKLVVNKQLEDLFWNGDTDASPASLCDGIIKQLVADATVVDVSGTTLSASNIIAEIGKVYSAIPNTIKHSQDLVIFISPAAASFYKQATAALTGNTNAGYVGDKELNYLGTKLIVAPAMPVNDMVACDPQNLWLATDLVSDFEDIEVINMRPFSGSKFVRFVAGIKFGVGFGVGSEIVYYT